MLNKIIVQGRLVADPELKNTQSGIAVCSVRIAVDRDFKDKQTGEKKADFFTVTAWRNTAEFLSKYFSKGRLVVVEGQLQNKEWTDKDGNKRVSDEIIASNVYFCASKKDSEQSGNETYTAPAELNAEDAEPVEEGELPF